MSSNSQIGQVLEQVKENLQKEINTLQNKILLSGTIDQDIKRVELELSTILNLSASLGISDQVRSHFMSFLNNAIVLPIEGCEILVPQVNQSTPQSSDVFKQSEPTEKKTRKPRDNDGLTQRDRIRIKSMVKEFLGIEPSAKPREQQLQLDLVAKIFDAGLSDLSDDLGAMEINDEFWKVAEIAIAQASSQVPPIIQEPEQPEELTESVSLVQEVEETVPIDNSVVVEEVAPQEIIEQIIEESKEFKANDIVRDIVTNKVGTVVDATPIKNFGGDQLLIKYVDGSTPTAIAFLELIQSADVVAVIESANSNQSSVTEQPTIDSDDDEEELDDESKELLAKILAMDEERKTATVPSDSWF